MSLGASQQPNDLNIETDKVKRDDLNVLEENGEPIVKKVKVLNNGLKEVEVGIQQYLQPGLKGFKGDIKARFKDFLVNEIDLEGNVLHLEPNQSINKDRLNQPENENSEVKVVVEKPKLEKPNQEFYNGLSDLFVSFQVDVGIIETELNELKQAIDNESKLGYTPDIVITEKLQRTSVHQLVRTLTNGHVETKVTPDNKITFIYKKKPVQKFKSKSEAKLADRYCHFNLYKENQDTMKLLSSLASILKVPTKSFQFVGTKDKRGCTVQKVSVYNVNENRLKGINRRLRNASMSTFSMHKNQLQLGELSGNQFTVVIRDLTFNSSTSSAPLDEIQASVESDLNLFHSNDFQFLNYFGLQRFGTTSLSSHSLGQLLLTSQYNTFVETLFQPQTSDSPEMVTLKEQFAKDNDTKAFLAKCPTYHTAERALLTAFSDNVDRTNPLAAILRIPRTLLLMYLHAYQSFIFNQVLSLRIKHYGSKPILGDLVMLPSNSVKVLNCAEDLETFKFDQIVLPLPGHQVKYPEYQQPELKDIYTKLMSEQQLDPSAMARKVKEFSLNGDYRLLVEKAAKFEWEFLKYDDPIQDLTLTDLDRLNSKSEILSKPDGTRLALKLTFQLKPSTYATMLLKQVMKSDN